MTMDLNNIPAQPTGQAEGTTSANQAPSTGQQVNAPAPQAHQPTQQTTIPSADQAEQQPPAAPPQPTSQANTNPFDLSNPQPVDIRWDVEQGTLSAIQLLGAQGVDTYALHDLVQDAVQSYDPSKLNPAAFMQKYGDKAPQAMQVAHSIVRDAQAALERTKTHVFGLVGGEQQWNSLVGTFKGAAPELVPAVQTLVNNKQFEAAINFMKQTMQSRGVAYQAMQGVTGSVQPVAQGMDAATFKAEVAKLHKEFPNASFEPHTEAGRRLQALFEKRKSAM